MEEASLHTPNLSALRAELMTELGMELAGVFEGAGSIEEVRTALKGAIDDRLHRKEVTLRDAEDPMA